MVYAYKLVSFQVIFLHKKVMYGMEKVLPCTFNGAMVPCVYTSFVCCHCKAIYVSLARSCIQVYAGAYKCMHALCHFFGMVLADVPCAILHRENVPKTIMQKS